MVERNARGQFIASPGPRPRDPVTGKFIKSPFAPVLFEDAAPPSRAGWWLLGAAVVVGVVAAQVLP
jgi:hypothetical protein